MSNEREVKIGDWGWFWRDVADGAIFSKLSSVDNSDPYPYVDMEDSVFKHFTHEHPAGKFVVLNKEESREQRE